jgi:unsaturated pyranuronate lyase
MSFYDFERMTPAEITGTYLRKTAAGENITVAQVEVKQGSVTQAHRHENEEVVLVLKGRWRFNLPDGEVDVGPHQMLCISPGVEHSSEALEDTVALDICAPTREDWVTGTDHNLHNDPDQFLWAV